MKYFVYMLRCSDGTLYTGITTDVARRVFEHNESDKGAKYTKVRRPVKLVYAKKFINRSSASSEEFRLKKLNRRQKEDIIAKDNEKI